VRRLSHNASLGEAGPPALVELNVYHLSLVIGTNGKHRSGTSAAVSPEVFLTRNGDDVATGFEVNPEYRIPASIVRSSLAINAKLVHAGLRKSSVRGRLSRTPCARDHAGFRTFAGTTTSRLPGDGFLVGLRPPAQIHLGLVRRGTEPYESAGEKNEFPDTRGGWQMPLRVRQMSDSCRPKNILTSLPWRESDQIRVGRIEESFPKKTAAA